MRKFILIAFCLLMVIVILFFRQEVDRHIPPRESKYDFEIHIPGAKPIKMLYVNAIATYSVGGKSLEVDSLFEYFSVSSHMYQPRQARTVSISPFFLSETEITNSQFQAIINGHLKSDDEPVSFLSIDDIQVFCSNLASYSGRLVRLPFEYEWECACRSGSSYQYDFDSRKEGLVVYANISLPTSSVPAKILPVKSRRPNKWGFFDLFGNVQEPTLPFGVDPFNWDLFKGQPIILCGGTYKGIPVNSPSAGWSVNLLSKMEATGLRIACSP